MENKLKTSLDVSPAPTDWVSESPDLIAAALKPKSESEISLGNNRTSGIKSINLTGEKLVITADLSAVFCQGVQYYDLKNILFINNTGMANLIKLLKSLLIQGVQVQFVNVADKIKEKVKSMGLENILNCT